MPKVIVTSLTRCQDQMHYKFTGTYDGKVVEFGTTFAEINEIVDRLPPREQFILRLHFDAIDNNITTFAGLVNRVEGREYNL